MKESRHTFDDPADEEVIKIDIAKIIGQLKRGWKRIALWGGIALVIGIIVAISIPREYTVTVELAPESSGSSGTTKIGSLTNMLGLSGLTNTNDALTPTLYPKMVKATPFLVNLMETEVIKEDDEELTVMTLQDYLKNHTRRPWWKSAYLCVKRMLKGQSKSSRQVGTIDPYHLTKGQNATIQRLSSMINVSVDKKTSAIKITTTAQNAHVAADLCQTVTQQLQDEVTRYRTDKAKRNLAYYEGLYNDAKEAYQKAQTAYAHYVDSHQGIFLLSVKAEQDRLMNEMNLKYQLYNSVANELQSAKAKVQLETPVFAELIPATVPLKHSKPKGKLIIFALCFLGLCAGCGEVLLRARLAETGVEEE